MNRHYSESDFLNRLYEVGREDQHLEECPTCRAQWETWVAARQQLVREPEVPADFLAAQRRQILSSAGQPLGSFSKFWHWTPALAMVAMALFAILWQAPAPKPVVEEAPVAKKTAPSDAELMADIYRTVYRVEPQSVAPLHGLFEDKGEAND